MMKHVVAFDVSMGKSTMVIYNQYRQCEVEKEIEHNRPSFEQLHETFQALITQDGQAPEIVFEEPVYTPNHWNDFFKAIIIHIAVLTHLKQIYKWLQCCVKKQIKAMHTN